MGASKFLPKVILALLAVAVASGAGGCAENRSSFFIPFAVAVTGEEDACTIEIGEDTAVITRGTMDLELTSHYVVALAFANQLIPRSVPTQLRTETNIILVEGAEVTVTPIGSGSVDTPSYTIPFAISVFPDADGIGESAALVELVPDGVISEPGDYMLEVRAFGRTTGGTSLETPIWNYPLHVCNDRCLAVCPGDPAQVELIVPPCIGVWGSDYNVDARAYPGGRCF
jgi:hypothetical protein